MLSEATHLQGGNLACQDAYDLRSEETHNGMRSTSSTTHMIVAAPNIISTTGTVFGKGITLKDSTWFLAVYNDISGSSDLVYQIEAYATRDVQCKNPACSFQGNCDTKRGQCICRCEHGGAGDGFIDVALE